MRARIVPLLLLGAASLLAGCSTPAPKFMSWRKSAIRVELTTPMEVQRLIDEARLELEDLDLGPLVAPLHRLGSAELAVVKRSSLFGVVWRPDYPAGLEGHVVRGQLSVAIDYNWFEMDGGDVKIEAILAGIHDPEVEPARVEVATQQALRDVVARLNRLALRVCEEDGRRASVVAWDETN